MAVPRLYQRLAHKYPFRADTPNQGISVSARRHFPCLTTHLNDGVSMRWAFKTRSQRDKFVSAHKHLGARNTRG
jgi:hypothetical protein